MTTPDNTNGVPMTRPEELIASHDGIGRRGRLRSRRRDPLRSPSSKRTS